MNAATLKYKLEKNFMTGLKTIKCFNEENEVVGVLYAKQNKNGWYIQMVEVEKPYRNNGIYNKMVSILLDDVYSFWSFSRSPEANDIYEKKLGKQIEPNQFVKVSKTGLKLYKRFFNN